MLHVQSSGVGPAVSKLAPVESQYRQLASALDSTRHHMPTKGIYLPADGKEQYLGETCFYSNDIYYCQSEFCFNCSIFRGHHRFL